MSNSEIKLLDKVLVKPRNRIGTVVKLTDTYCNVYYSTDKCAYFDGLRLINIHNKTKSILGERVSLSNIKVISEKELHFYKNLFE